jgi:aspartyl protease family protein
LKAVVGRVTIEHRLGMRLAEIPAAVIAGRWVALPVRACYGGDIWWFRSQEADPVRMVAGLWRDGDPISLWEVEDAREFEGPDLGSWEPHAHLTWKSLLSEQTRSVLTTRVKEQSDRFARIALDDLPTEAGLFFQDGDVVGWTFGSPVEEGILWIGPSGEDLVSTIRVDHFYNLTFANGREEYFLRALATNRDLSELESLELLTEGFRRKPELIPEETPASLTSVRAALRMQEIASDLLEKDLAHEVADLLDIDVLKEAKHTGLMKQALRATRSYYGSASTVDLAERLVEETGNMPDFDDVAFRSYAKTVFLDWIGERIDQSDTLGAWRAYRRADALFPDAVDVRLIGAEIALKNGDWKRAKDLLPSRSVPAPFADSAARLAEEVSRLEAEEGKLVIRFPPGSRHIPVEAVLNDQVEQNFAIDTGASLVTIPSSTAQALGLKLTNRTPQRIVSTAGGAVRAWEVTLDSVTVKGLSVNKVQAWVLDIPGRPTLGLLGLNYLNRFHMEIDNNRGVLMLKPR